MDTIAIGNLLNLFTLSATAVNPSGNVTLTPLTSAGVAVPANQVLWVTSLSIFGEDTTPTTDEIVHWSLADTLGIIRQEGSARVAATHAAATPGPANASLNQLVFEVPIPLWPNASTGAAQFVFQVGGPGNTATTTMFFNATGFFTSKTPTQLTGSTTNEG